MSSRGAIRGRLLAIWVGTTNSTAKYLQGSRIATRHYDRYDMLPEMREGMLQWDKWLDGCLSAS